MYRRISPFVFFFVLLCAGCASYSGSSLKPGTSSLQDVIKTMGAPAVQWTEQDGSKQLSYPRGPFGFQSYMVYLDSERRLLRIENVMTTPVFARVTSGMTQDQVIKVLGPSEPRWSAYYKARNELVWEWRYCDIWNSAARFDVKFDAGNSLVRSTQSRREDCGKTRCDCAR